MNCLKAFSFMIKKADIDVDTRLMLFVESLYSLLTLDSCNAWQNLTLDSFEQSTTAS